MKELRNKYDNRYKNTGHALENGFFDESLVLSAVIIAICSNFFNPHVMIVGEVRVSQRGIHAKAEQLLYSDV